MITRSFHQSIPMFQMSLIFLFLSSNDSIRNSRNLPSIKYDKIILWLVLISNDTASSENRKYIFEGGWQTDTVATYFDHTICLNLSLAYESLMKRSSEFGHIILCRKKTFFFSSSITTYGSWLLTFDRFGIMCNMTGYAIWVVDSSTTCIIGTWKWWIWFSILCNKYPISRAL